MYESRFQITLVHRGVDDTAELPLRHPMEPPVGGSFAFRHPCRETIEIVYYPDGHCRIINRLIPVVVLYAIPTTIRHPDSSANPI